MKHPALRDPSDRPLLAPSSATRALAQAGFVCRVGLMFVGLALGACASPLRALLGALRARR